jgi:hypothetical protein
MLELRHVMRAVLTVAILFSQPNGLHTTGPAANSAASVLTANSQSWPGDYPEPASLKGLRTVSLIVYADQTIPSYPGTKAPLAGEIKNRILQQLRDAGITVANQTEAESILQLSMYLVCDPDGSSCGYHTMLELRQWAALKRDPNMRIAAITWRNSYTNGVSKKNLACCLADLLAVDAFSLVGNFARDYREINSK